MCENIPNLHFDVIPFKMWVKVSWYCCNSLFKLRFNSIFYFFVFKNFHINSVQSWPSNHTGIEFNLSCQKWMIRFIKIYSNSWWQYFNIWGTIYSIKPRPFRYLLVSMSPRKTSFFIVASIWVNKIMTTS